MPGPEFISEGVFGEEAVTVRKKGGKPLPIDEALKDCDYFMVYFSAHWCPPCRAFTPQLKQFYENLKESKKMEVVFFSRDETEEEMTDYFDKAHGDWYALPHSFSSDRWPLLQVKYGLETIPAVLVFQRIEGAEPLLLNAAGRSWVVRDPTGAYFPWHGREEARPNLIGPTLLLCGAVIAAAVLLVEAVKLFSR